MACPECGAEVPEEFRFCGQCGVALEAASPADDAELRQITVLFCDIVGSTKMSADLGAEEFRNIVQGYYATCETILRRFGGHIAQFLGDGLLVYFGYPKAQEDGPRRAIHAALGIARAVEQQAEAGNEGPKLSVRLGVHTGPVAAGGVGVGARREQLALGFSTNIAAAIQTEAEPGTVAMSATTYELVRGFFECEPLGQRELKGTEVALYRARCETGARSRFDVSLAGGLSPAVGRHEKLGTLVERLEQSREGAGQVALVVGEAGIGKSRLLHRLKERCPDYDVAWLSCGCSEHHQQSAYQPLVGLLEQLLQTREGDPPSARLRSLEECLRASGIDLQEAVPALAPLLSLPLGDDYTPIEPVPLLLKQRTFKSLCELLARTAETRAQVLAFEDLHWADPSTLEFLTQWVMQSSSSRALTVMTCRPDFNVPWQPPDHAIELRLEPLLRSQVEEMVKGIAGGRALPPEVLRRVVDASDGIPLFIEEMMKSLLESGTLREAEDRYELAGPVHDLAVPATLQDLLAARLDRLGAAREIVQLGATLGREFRYEMIAAVWSGEEPKLERMLAELVDAELLFQQGVPPDATYYFKHALIQGVAHRGRLKRKRESDHRRIAAVLEERFPETCRTQPELLAHHCSEGGLPERAGEAWLAAGTLANERSAHLEAVEHLQRALDHVLSQPAGRERSQAELEIQMQLAQAWTPIRSYAGPEVEVATTRAYELCRELGETPELFWALWGQFAFYVMKSNYARCSELGEQLLRLAESTKDPDTLLPAHWGMAVVRSFTGDFEAAWRHAEAALALDPPGRTRILANARHTMTDVGASARLEAGRMLIQLGQSERGRALALEGVDLARRLESPYTVVHGLNQYCWVLVHDRDPDATLHWAQQLVASSSERGYVFFQLVGGFLAAWAEAACLPATTADDPEARKTRDEAVVRMRQSFELIRAAGAAMGAAGWIGAMAEVYLQHGLIEDARDLVEQARVHIEASGEGLYLPENLRLRAEVAAARDDSEESRKEAELLLEQAIQEARSQGTLAYELRAVHRLARLCADSGRREHARELLTSCRVRFPEGTDSPTVREADALLAQL